MSYPDLICGDCHNVVIQRVVGTEIKLVCTVCGKQIDNIEESQTRYTDKYSRYVVIGSEITKRFNPDASLFTEVIGYSEPCSCGNTKYVYTSETEAVCTKCTRRI